MINLKRQPESMREGDAKQGKPEKASLALPLIMIWTNSYERLTWTPMLVLLALQLDSPTALAFAASAYSAANLVGNLFFGSLSDRYGKFKVAGIALMCMMVTTLLHLRLWSAVALVVVRLFHGFFAAAVTPSSLAAASQGVEAESRGQIMARMGLMIAFASIVAPPLSGRLVDWLNPGAVDPTDMNLVPILLTQAVVLAVVGALGVAFHRRDVSVMAAPSLGADRDHAAGRAVVQPGGLDGFGLKATLFACLIGFSVMFGQNVLFYALPLKAVAARLTPSTIGALFGVFAVGAAVAFMPPFAKLSDRFGRIRPIVIGCATASIGLFLLGVGVDNGTLSTMAASLLLYGFGFGLAFPAVSASTADGADESRRGLAFGMLTAAFSLGAIAGPLVAQWLEPWVSPFTVASFVMAAGLSSVFVARNAEELHRVAAKLP